MHKETVTANTDHGKTLCVKPNGEPITRQINIPDNGSEEELIATFGSIRAMVVLALGARKVQLENECRIEYKSYQEKDEKVGKKNSVAKQLGW